MNNNEFKSTNSKTNNNETEKKKSKLPMPLKRSRTHASDLRVIPKEIHRSNSMMEIDLHKKAPFLIGERVMVRMPDNSVKFGFLRYLGGIDLDEGQWAGVELDNPDGLNNGSIGKRKYFECAPKYGIFTSVNSITKASTKKPAPKFPTPSTSSTNSISNKNKIDNCEKQLNEIQNKFNKEKSQRIKDLKTIENLRKELIILNNNRNSEVNNLSEKMTDEQFRFAECKSEYESMIDKLKAEIEALNREIEKLKLINAELIDKIRDMENGNLPIKSPNESKIESEEAKKTEILIQDMDKIIGELQINLEEKCQEFEKVNSELIEFKSLQQSDISGPHQLEMEIMLQMSEQRENVLSSELESINSRIHDKDRDIEVLEEEKRIYTHQIEELKKALQSVEIQNVDREYEVDLLKTKLKQVEGTLIERDVSV